MKNTDGVQEKSFLNSGASKIIIGFAAGAVAGAVTALLLAPKSGPETRKQIADSAVKVKDNLSEKVQEGMSKLSGQLKEKVDGLMQKAGTVHN